MAKRTITHINNSDTIRELEDAANVQLKDRVRRKLKPDVQPTINVNPKDYRIVDIVKEKSVVSSNTDTIIFSTSSGKNFYLTGFIFNNFSGGTGGTSGNQITAVINGETIKFYNVSISNNITINDQMNYSVPVKIDRGTDIKIKSSSSTVVIRCVIYGYEVDVI